MDYIQEELARQRLALALLMMGGRTQDPTEGPPETGEREPLFPEGQRRPAEGGARDRDGLWPWQKRPDGAALEQRVWKRTDMGQATPQEWRMAGESRLDPWDFSEETLDGGLMAENFGERPARAGETGVAGTGDPAEQAAPPESAVRERTVTEVLWAAPERALGPGELSRAFQRDARRYDGGFVLY
ncbi:hypothetical protein [uncultured Dysosmobacter sp.]|uniref:hypothetical protein n=1 Tax=uncultured Dysosmobacter sp. TaxID=2591384 RepID=UPI00261D5591|nr:hypothetical protein [uncultured Dysosmobacter sp.]